MKYESIYRFLENRIGLNINSMNESIVSSLIDRIIDESSAKNENQFLDSILNSNNHFQILISEILNSETWFFREKNTFAFFSEEIQIMSIGKLTFIIQKL